MSKTYWHVFARPANTLDLDTWFHEASRDTQTDANDDSTSLRRSGYKTLIIRSNEDPITLLNWLRTGGPTHVERMARIGQQTKEGRAQSAIGRVRPAYDEIPSIDRQRRERLGQFNNREEAAKAFYGNMTDNQQDVALSVAIKLNHIMLKHKIKQSKKHG